MSEWIDGPLRLPQPGEGWRHYSGTLYKIVSVGFETTKGAAVVIYQHYGEPPGIQCTYPFWVRPLDEFLGYTDTKEKRFQYSRAPTPTSGA